MQRILITKSYCRVIMVVVFSIVLVQSNAEPAIAETRRARQWHLDELRIPECRRLSNGQGVTVAVIDSGIDANHPDLRGNVLKGVDLNGNILAKYGWTDDDGHGTSMAGIIAARGGGPTHAYGIAPGSHILPVRVPVSPTQAIMARAIRWAVDHGADVINISLSLGYAQNVDETKSIGYALKHGVVVVAAAGNLGQNGHRMKDPADVPGVVSVTGTGRDGQFWAGSIHGQRATVAAPAVGIVSITSRNVYADGYSRGTGTSAAAAIVSGVFALIYSRFPRISATNAINRLVRTAHDKGATGWDPYYGYGIVDPLHALEDGVPNASKNPAGSPNVKNGSTWWSPDARENSQGDAAPSPSWAGVAIVGFILACMVGGLLIWRKRVRRDHLDGI